MPKHQQKRQEVETTASQQIELLQEQLEFCQELVESLKLELCYYQQEQQELEQELVHTNSDLCEALMSERICLEEAKAIAETIVKSKKSVSESLSELLSAIYDSQVELTELGIDKSIITKPSRSVDANIIKNSRELKNHSKQNHVQFKELGFQFVSLKAKYMKFRISSAKLRDKSKAKKDNESNFTPTQRIIL